MKLQGRINVKEFLALIDKCEGQVLLVTENGDRFNMTSKISQLVAATEILSKDAISKAEIIAKDPEDEKKIIAFLSNYKK